MTLGALPSVVSWEPSAALERYSNRETGSHGEESAKSISNERMKTMRKTVSASGIMALALMTVAAYTGDPVRGAPQVEGVGGGDERRP